MTINKKLQRLKTLLEDGGDVPSDEKLMTYLSIATEEILAWRYHLIGGVPEEVTDIPVEYEPTQIYAVIAGYTHAGAEGEHLHLENGVHRHFSYDDMLGYIRDNVLPYARVGAVK